MNERLLKKANLLRTRGQERKTLGRRLRFQREIALYKSDLQVKTEKVKQQFR